MVWLIDSRHRQLKNKTAWWLGTNDNERGQAKLILRWSWGLLLQLRNDSNY
jgi:hypothetical protein